MAMSSFQTSHDMIIAFKINTDYSIYIYNVFVDMICKLPKSLVSSIYLLASLHFRFSMHQVPLTCHEKICPKGFEVAFGQKRCSQVLLAVWVIA